MRSILSIGAVLLLPVALMGIKHMHQGASMVKLKNCLVSPYPCTQLLWYICVSVKRFLIKKTPYFYHSVFNPTFQSNALCKDIYLWKLKISLKLTLSWFILQKPLACIITGLL